jgi:hypothetical protein
MHYTVHLARRRIVGVMGDKIPRYEIKQHAVLGSFAYKCNATSPVDGGREVATIGFQSSKVEIAFPQRDREVAIKAIDGDYESTGGLGCLHWKPTGMVPFGEASWELRDESNLVMSVEIDGNQINGVMSLWKEGIDPETVEELMVVGVSKIEEYKKLMRGSKRFRVQIASSVPWLAEESRAQYC